MRPRQGYLRPNSCRETEPPDRTHEAPLANGSRSMNDPVAALNVIVQCTIRLDTRRLLSYYLLFNAHSAIEGEELTWASQDQSERRANRRAATALPRLRPV